MTTINYIFKVYHGSIEGNIGRISSPHYIRKNQTVIVLPTKIGKGIDNGKRHRVRRAG